MPDITSSVISSFHHRETKTISIPRNAPQDLLVALECRRNDARCFHLKATFQCPGGAGDVRTARYLKATTHGQKAMNVPPPHVSKYPCMWHQPIIEDGTSALYLTSRSFTHTAMKLDIEWDVSDQLGRWFVLPKPAADHRCVTFCLEQPQPAVQQEILDRPRLGDEDAGHPVRQRASAEGRHLGDEGRQGRP